MSIFMAGADYKKNSLDKRERLAFTYEKTARICAGAKKLFNVDGCVVISTCNRTEIYISDKNMTENNADEILLRCAEINDFDGVFDKREGKEAVFHLIELSCGLKSRIVGEEQIIGQINLAAEISRSKGCSDPFLNTLFRIAVSAGKYAVTNALITGLKPSCANEAVEFLKRKYKSLYKKKCVVIGNGKIGKMAQRLLIKEGCVVFVTLREYKNGNNDYIKGCEPVGYSERYKYIDKADFVISATKSPHYTLTEEGLKKISHLPEVIVDLAVPRDVESSVGGLCGCVSIDELGDGLSIDKKKLFKVHNIAEKFCGDYFRWENYKNSIEHIEFIKNIISERIIKSMEYEKKEIIQEIVNETVKKTTDIIMGGMKGCVEPGIIYKCRKKIEERARL